MPENGTLILAVGWSNVKVRRSTGFCVPICLSGLIKIKQEGRHRVDVAPKLFELGRRPQVRLGPDEFA